MRVLWIGTVALLLTLGGGASVCYGWTFSTASPGTLWLSREASDTDTETVFVYRNLSAPSALQLRDGSFDSTAGGGFFYNTLQTSVAVDAQTQFISYPKNAGYSYMLAIRDGTRWYIGQDFAQPVYLAHALGYSEVVTLPVSWSATSTVSLSSSVSVDGTLPVDVTRIGGVESDALSLSFAALLVVAGGMIGWGVAPWRG